jgi:serine/threonine protein kinase
MEVYYQKELDTLAVIRELNHPHLIKPIATYQRGEAHCFMFPWADGDNLRKFWEEADKQADKPLMTRIQRDPELVSWVLEQMRGLADGLHALYDRNCRHGDLKPENILRFAKNGARGILLIADMGLAKFHILATQQRLAPSSTSEGTFRYAPPEIDDKKSDKPLSRAYDVWSMGCIYLEFLIWLLGGHAWLQEFNKSGSGNFDKFWEFKENDKKYRVHSVVSRWIDRLSERLRCDDPRVDTALKAILQLVKTRLLLVKLEGEGVPEEEARANATELFKSVAAIYDRAASDPNYLFDASIWRRAKTSISSPSSLEPPKRADIPYGFVTPLRPAPSKSDDDGDLQFTVHATPDDGTIPIPTSRQAVQEVSFSLHRVAYA